MKILTTFVVCSFVLLLCLLAAPYNSQLGSQIDTYLAAKGSPLSGSGSVFFSSGEEYKVDPRLVVAISGAESSFATVWAACPASGFNAWSWFYNGNCANSPFSSFGEGIQTVTKFMRKSYFNKGYRSISAIGSKYCAEGCSSWVPNVTKFYKEQGGDENDLTFSASMVTFYFTGEVTWIIGGSFPQVARGDKVSGFYTFNTAPSNSNGYYFLIGSTYHISIGSFTEDGVLDTIVVLDSKDGVADVYSVTGHNSSYSKYFDIYMNDPTGLMFSDTSLPVSPPFIGFQNQQWHYHLPIPTPPAMPFYDEVGGDLTSLSLSPIP